jgi:hypothetical protein
VTGEEETGSSHRLYSVDVISMATCSSRGLTGLIERSYAAASATTIVTAVMHMCDMLMLGWVQGPVQDDEQHHP